MEGSIVAVEENHQRADSANGAPNSLGSLVKIDSISIDLGIPMETKNDTGDKCHHFTIRGYVAEMREKDRKLCDPFSLFRKDSNPEEQLPPLAVTKGKRWKCKKCPREISSASASEEIGGAVSKCCEREIISGSSHMPAHGDGAADQSHLSESQALEIYERRETDLNISANSDGHEITFLLDKKGKNAEVGDLATRGHDNGLEDNATREVSNQACELQILNQCPVNEAHTESAVPVQTKSSKSVEISEPNCELQDVVGVLLAIEYPTCGSAEKGQKPEESGELNEETKTDKGKRIILPSFEGEEFETASPESEEVMAEDDDPIQHPGSSASVQRKRPQKVRLLTELLGSKENPEKDNKRTGGGCPNAVPNSSNGLASLSANQNEPSLDGTLGNASLGPERKRKIEEEKQTMDFSWMKNVGKKARTLKGDEDHTKIAIEISDSETEDNVPLGAKSKLKKNGIDRNPNPGQKKNRQAQFVDGYLPLGSWGDVIPKANHNKMKDAEKTGGATVADSCFLKSANDPFKNRGMESYFRNYMPLQHTGKESCSSSKKKSKMPQVEERQACLMPPSRSNDIRFLQNGSDMAKSQKGNDISTTMGLDLSLSGFMTAERNEKTHVAQAADKSGFLLPRPKAIPSKDIRRKDGMFVGESSISRKSAPDQFMRERLNYDLNQKIAHGTAMPREQQNCSPRLEDGSFLMRHNLDLSGPSNSKRPSEGHGRLEPVRRQSDQRGGKVFEQGISEEIPMEIVELMAKNQYERGLCEPEKNSYRRNNNNKRTNSEMMMMGFPNKQVHGNGVMRILPKEYPSMRKPPPTNGLLQTSENVVPSKPNHVSFYSPDHRSRFNVDPQEENPGIKMFDAFSPSIRFQNSFQNDKLEHFWSFRPQVTEDCPTQANKIPEKNKGKVVREFDLNRALNTSNFENPNYTPASEPFTGMSMAYHASAREQRGPPDRNPKMMGSSFDSFSQDAIPAMQLLSLMDAGLNTSKPFDVDPKRVLEKPFYPCGNHPNFSMEKPLFQCNYNSKAFSGVGSGVVYKAGESSRHPSSSTLNNYGKIQNSEKACVCAADPSVSLFQTDRNSKRPIGTENRIFFKPREQEKERRSNPTPQNKPRKSQKSGAPPPTVLEFKSVQDKQKGVAGPSNAALAKDSGKRVDLEENYRRGTVRPVKLTSRSVVCTLNKNPAEFSIPEKGNVYTISGEDLRFPKKNPPKAKSKILRQ